MARTLEEIVFLVNPAAGSGRGAVVWRALCDSHPELGAARVVRESDPAAARAAVAASLASGARALVAVGGDGTMHHAANALLGCGLAERVPLGIVPAGTGSDLARSLGIPMSPGRALELALAGEPRPLDAIEVRTGGGPSRWIVNSASAGLSGVVVEAVNALPRRRQSSYVAATVRALVHYRPLPCRVAVDGGPFFEGAAFLWAATNGPTFGKGMRVAPRARLDDGLIDVVVVGDVPRWLLPLRLPQVLLGRHLGLPKVHHRQGRQVSWEPLVPFPPFELDGEAMPNAAAELLVQPGALRVLR
jgi:diacylglycerol kinase (ATP)